MFASAFPDSAFTEADQGTSTRANESGSGLTKFDVSIQTSSDASGPIDRDASGQTGGDSAQTFGDSARGGGQLGGQGFGGRGGPFGSLGTALSTLAHFSIAFLFAALTAFIDRSLRRRKRRAAPRARLT